jgi:hypothetical protein
MCLDSDINQQRTPVEKGNRGSLLLIARIGLLKINLIITLDKRL